MWYPPSKQQIESNTNPFRALTPEQMCQKMMQEIEEAKKVKVPTKLLKDFQKEIKNERDYQFAGTDSREDKKEIIEDEKELLNVLKLLQKGQIEKAYDAFDELDTALADVVPQKLLKFMDDNIQEARSVPLVSRGQGTSRVDTHPSDSERLYQAKDKKEYEKLMSDAESAMLKGMVAKFGIVGDYKKHTVNIKFKDARSRKKFERMHSIEEAYTPKQKEAIQKVKQVLFRDNKIGFYTATGKIMVQPKDEEKAKEVLDQAFGGDFTKSTGLVVKKGIGPKRDFKINASNESVELDETVSDKPYRDSHGKKPNPNESGGWYFSSTPYSGGGDEDVVYQSPNAMKYKDAKKEAEKVAKKKGLKKVYVMASYDPQLDEDAATQRFFSGVHAELKKVMDNKYYSEFRAANDGRALDNVINHFGKSRGYRVDKTVKSIIDKYGRNRDEYVKKSFQSAASGTIREDVELEEGSMKREMMDIKDKLTKAGIRSAIMFGEVHVAPNNVKEAEKIIGKSSFKVVPQKKLEEMSAKDHYRKVMRGGKGKGFVVSTPIDRERYPNREREGLEGPYKSRKSGKIFYYDKKAGKYYDPDSDMFLDVSDVMESTQLDEVITLKFDSFEDAAKFAENLRGKNLASVTSQYKERGEYLVDISGPHQAGAGSPTRAHQQLAKIMKKHGGKLHKTNEGPRIARMFKENPEYDRELSDMNIGEINEKVKRPMGLPGKFPPKGKFTKQQIDTLRKEYAKIGTVDPGSKTYENLTNFLDSLSDEMIGQLAKAKIKFISGLALNRAVKRGVPLKDSYEFDSKTGEYVRADGEDPLGINGGMHRQVAESVEESPEEIMDMRFSEADEPTLEEGVDEVAARELTLYIENDSTIYRQRIQPIIKNLARKMKKGTYDPDLAIKGFMYAVEHGIKSYNKEFGPGFKIDKITKRKVAEDLRDNFMDEIEDAV